MADLSKITSSCYCGAILLEYSVEGDNFITSFICHCTDDRKITSSVFASNFVIVSDATLLNSGTLVFDPADASSPRRKTTPSSTSVARTISQSTNARAVSRQETRWTATSANRAVR